MINANKARKLSKNRSSNRCEELLNELEKEIYINANMNMSLAYITVERDYVPFLTEVAMKEGFLVEIIRDPFQEYNVSLVVHW